MNFAKTITALALSALLGACGSSDRFSAPTPAIEQSQRIAFRSIEVRDVSLPSYAAADEIHTQTPDGTMVSSKKTLWGDAPERAVALDMALALSKMTGARVASEPWPLEAYPQARLELRFAQLIAGTDGIFRTSGQYFVAVLDGGAERSGLFDLTLAYDPAGGPNAIAAARTQIIVDLARFIARDGLR